MNKHFDGLTAEITLKKEVDGFAFVSIKNNEDGTTGFVSDLTTECKASDMFKIITRLIATSISECQKRGVSKETLEFVIARIFHNAFAMAEEDRKNDLQERMENGEVKL